MGLEDYKKASHTTDIVVLAYDVIETAAIKMADLIRLKVLLVNRQEDCFKGVWALPGGFVGYNDTLISTAKSKLKTKAGIGDVYMEQLYTYGDDLERDPRGRVISTAYIALVNIDNVEMLEENARWFTLIADIDASGKTSDIHVLDEFNNREEVELAFDHKTILKDALDRLRNKLLYTNVVLNMLPEQFKLREVQDLYELILGKPFKTFRRFIQDKVEPTGYKIVGEGYRPSELYRVRKEAVEE